MLRAGASDAELRGALLAGIAAKPERHDFNARLERAALRAQTGG